MITSHKYVRKRNLTSSILGVGSEMRLYTRLDSVKTEPADKHVRTTSENLEENFRSVFALSFSS